MSHSSILSSEELNAEIKRLEDLRRERNAAAVKEVEEMSKHPLSLEQMRAQIARNKKMAEEMRAGRSTKSQQKD